MNGIFNAISRIIMAITNVVVRTTEITERALDGVDNVTDAMVVHTEILKKQSHYECDKVSLELDSQIADLKAEIEARSKA